MSVYYADEQILLLCGDALAVLRTLADESAGCVVTSPPYYGLRDYGEAGQYGLEATPGQYVETMRAVFAEVRRVLAVDGTLWLNLGDSYAGTSETGRNDARRIGRGGLPQYGSLAQDEERRTRRLQNDYGRAPKNLLGMPWRVAFALQDDGWTLRNAVIWDKPNAMPESVTDRLSTTYETVFMFSRSPRYWFDLDPVRERLAHPDALDGSRPIGGKAKGGPAGRTGASARRAGGDPSRSWYGVTGMPDQVNMGPVGVRHGGRSHTLGRNPGDVWTVPTAPFAEAHFAVMAPEVARRCIVSGAKPGAVVLDPFCGSGTTGAVAGRHGHPFVGIDISAAYLELALRTRLAQAAVLDVA